MHYVIVGNGVAGTTAAEQIRHHDAEGTISIITDERYPFYNRIRLIEYLTGKISEEDLAMKQASWYREQGMTLLTDTTVEDADPGSKKLILSSGKHVPYDRLLIATGGLSSSPPIIGSTMEGVFTLRTLDDAKSIVERTKNGGKNIVIIGGGVLGLEAGNSLLKSGNKITVVEFFPRLLPRQMDSDGAAILQRQMESMGFTFYLGAVTQEISGAAKAQRVVLKDGRSIPCDLVIISAGIRCNIDIPQKMGLKCEKGLVVNDLMETDLPEIFGAGDVIQHRGICYGIWGAAEQQGRVAGINMAGGNDVYEGTTISNVLKVAGISLFSSGNIDAEGNFRSIVSSDADDFAYKKLVLDNGKIIGSILYGDIKDMVKILKAIREGRDVSTFEDSLEQWDLSGL